MQLLSLTRLDLLSLAMSFKSLAEALCLTAAISWTGYCFGIKAAELPSEDILVA